MDELTKDMSEKLNRIRDMIMIKAHSECSAIRREMDDYHQQKLSKYRGSFSAETTRQMEADIRSATRHADAALARHKAALKQKQYALRLERCKQVFDEAEAALVQFTQSAQYAADMQARAAEARAQFADGEPLTLMLREADRPLADALQAALGGCAVEFTTQIRLGGLMLQNSAGLIIDESLDGAFADAQQQFTRTCGVILAE